NNYSGECASVRWFVPFLAPAYFALAVELRERPALFRYLVVLSGWGAVLAAFMWWRGPWNAHTGVVLWPGWIAVLVPFGVRELAPAVGWAGRWDSMRPLQPPQSASTLTHSKAAASRRV